ncbi:MAG: kinase [Candidatus Omnitrophica bacterium]|nr:kinase [Candidatus Omnitrophota bacterium]
MDEIKHPSVRECLRFFNITHGIEMVHTSDLPARTGIGSSSAFTVGFLKCLYALKGKMVTKRQLALDAIHIEQNIIKENVGSQDQTAVAFGGFNKIEFGGHQEMTVYPVTLSREKQDFFQKHLMLFFTGFSRNASDVAEEQIKNIPEKKQELKIIRQMVEEAFDVLNGNEDNIDDFGKLLHKSWQVKRKLSSKISTSRIDEIYEAAISAGALGGKLLGAGGGGFMLLFVKPELQDRVKECLKGLLYVPFSFETLGSQTIYYAPNDNF